MSTITMIKELSSECSSGICFMSTREMRNAAVRMYPIGVNEGKMELFWASLHDGRTEDGNMHAGFMQPVSERKLFSSESVLI